MMFYFVVLALSLYFIYALRDFLLVLQNRRDAKLAAQEASRAQLADTVCIIQQNQPQCKRFERAS